MSIASSAFKRLRGLYRIVFRRMREHEARLFGGLGGSSGRPMAGRLSGEGSSRGCRIEQLEPRLMLDASGPQIVAHWPTGLVQPVDHVEITFNEPIDPSTLSAGGVLIMHPSPVRLGGYDTTGSARGVAISGTRAYVADGSTGLQIIDMSNPAAPQKIGGLDTAGSAMGVAVYGTLAFVADYTAGLQVIDVSNPSAPVLVGTYDTAGAAYGVTVSGPLAFVADYGAGLVVLDVSNPSAPRRLAGLDTPGAARGVAVSGSRAYVADETAGLQVINVLAEVAGVTKTGDATYRIDLPGVLPDGEYRVFVGPEVTDLAGNAMDQNANGIGGQVSDALGFSFTTSTASPAPAVPSVAGRHVFYNNSVWDVGNFALNAANAASATDDADDGAIAAGVSALLPG